MYIYVKVYTACMIQHELVPCIVRKKTLGCVSQICASRYSPVTLYDNKGDTRSIRKKSFDFEVFNLISFNFVVCTFVLKLT